MTSPTNTTTIRNVALMAPGRWELPGGPVEIRPAHLHAAAAALDSPGVRPPRVVLDVVDARVRPHPVMGRVDNLRVSTDGVLRGDITGLPAQWSDTVIPAFDERAVEASLDTTDAAGNHHALLLRTVRVPATLTAHPDALAAMSELTARYGTAEPDHEASTLLAAARHDLTGERDRTPEPASVLTPDQAGRLAALVGLGPDADADTLVSVLNVRLQARAVTPAADGGPPPGHVLIDGDVLAQLHVQAGRGAAARTEALHAQVDAAIVARKVPAGRRDHWLSLLTTEPERTTEVLASLPTGMVPETDDLAAPAT